MKTKEKKQVSFLNDVYISKCSSQLHGDIRLAIVNLVLFRLRITLQIRNKIACQFYTSYVIDQNFKFCLIG